MRTFSCSCGNTLYFDNTLCIQCGKELGFNPVTGKTQVIEANSPFRKCKNYHETDVCNWLVAQDDPHEFCLACRLNEVIPDLSNHDNVQRWYKMEKAKRRLIYTLLKLRLPIVDKTADSDNGLSFRFMEDVKGIDPYTEEIVTYEKIMTGHNAGTITINIVEADDSMREEIREKMNESYRTILGHFRHEIGHYYWNQLIANSELIDEFRQLFGDEQKDYQSALQRYYKDGPRDDWPDQYISAYASAHPWEDWAESWAHYLHFMDVLETASHHHVGLQGVELTDEQSNVRRWLQSQKFSEVILLLGQLMRILNELNRSLGFPDPYPFEHSPNVVKKLEFIHRVVMAT